MGQINNCSCWVWKEKSAKFVILTNVVNSHHACNITHVTYVHNRSYISSWFEPKSQCVSSPSFVAENLTKLLSYDKRTTMLIYMSFCELLSLDLFSRLGMRMCWDFHMLPPDLSYGATMRWTSIPLSEMSQQHLDSAPWTFMLPLI